MNRKKVLINDIEPRDVAGLRRALVAAGFDVRIVDNSAETLKLLESFKPRLVLSEVRMPEMDGPHLLREIRSRPLMQNVPFIMVGRLRTVEERVNIMKLAIDDYLQKPFDVDDAVVRIENLIKETELIATTQPRQWRGFNGNLSEMNLVDLIQTLEVGKKTCVVKLSSNGKEGAVYIAEGQVIDAELADLEAKTALLRMFTWSSGSFQVELRQHDRPRILTVPNRDLISEGMTRQYRWEQLTSQLPSLNSAATLAQSPDPTKLDQEELDLLKLIKESHPKQLIEVIEECSSDDLRAMTVFKKLYEHGVVKMIPFPVDQINTRDIKRLQQWGTLGQNGANQLDQMFKLALTAPNEPPIRRHERRRTERRLLPDRRRYDRRRGEKERNKIHLKKSELLMIQDKLAHLADAV